LTFAYLIPFDWNVATIWKAS